jgi:eukaryotic-like serine/threonine-protein kinase
MFRAYLAPLIFISSLTCSLFAAPPVSQRTEKPSLSKPLIKSWFFETVDTSDFTPTVHADLVFLPLANGTLVALDAVSGALRWRSEFGGYISAAPASDERGVYIATEIRAEGKSPVPAATGALRLIGNQSGVTLWVRPLHAPIRTALAVNSTNVFAGTVDGKLYSIKKSTGEVAWVKTSPFPFNSHPLLFDDRLYVGDEVGNLFAIEQNTGRTSWRYRTRGSLRASVAVSGGTVFGSFALAFAHGGRDSVGRSDAALCPGHVA